MSEPADHPVTGAQCRAARALVEWPRDHVAARAHIPVAALADFEAGIGSLEDEARRRLRQALESGGAVFIPENGGGGIGVRLRFSSGDVRVLNKWEGEGGQVGDDDV